MKAQHFSQAACALAFAGLTAFPAGSFADAQRDAALAAEIEALKAQNKARRERINDPLPPIEGVAKADPAETACKLAVHQAALDACKKKGQYNCPYPKGEDLRRCYSKNKTPAANSHSVPAPKDWVTQPGLLPATPQPAPTGTGNGPTCTVRFADGTTTVVPDGSLIIPDTQTLYYVGASAPCAVDSFVRLSAREGLTATVGGGRYKVPAPPGATPAAALVANPATAEAVVTAFTAASGLFAGWFAARAIQKLKTNNGNVIVVTNETPGEAPDGGPYEDYLARPVTQKAIELSTRSGRGRNTGQCNDDEFNRLYSTNQTTACNPDMNTRCEPTDPSKVLTAKSMVLKACIDARINVMDTCFDGGDQGHKDRAKEMVNGLRRCESALRKLSP